MEQIIELENADDITSIRSRIEFLLPTLTQQSVQAGGPERPRLLLIVPRKNKALRSLVNMKLLARITGTRTVDVAIVSGHPRVRDYAKEAGVKVFGTIRSAKRAGWVTSKTPVASPTETIPPVAPSPTEDELYDGQRSPGARVQKRKYVVVSGRIGVLQQLGALILVFVLAAALVFGVIALLPQATVTITPVSRPVETKLIVKGDPDVESIDFKELTFPARVDQVELELFGEVETIETELAPVGKATGPVVFVNRTEDEQIIPVTTTVSTSAGEPVKFTTVETATIPPGVGATSTPTLVIAVDPGPTGNVLAGQINRFEEPSYALVARVVNESPIGGGTLEPAKIVVQTDKERLDAYLRQKIQQEGLNQLQASLGAQEFITPESVQVIVLDVNYRDFSGDFSDTFGGEMQAVVRATVIGGYNANRLALAALEAQVPPGYELDVEGLNFGAGEVLGIQDNQVSFRIFATGQALPVIDERKIAKDIAWLPVGEAQELLDQQYKLATIPAVELSPDWLVDRLGRLPLSPIRINVVINDAVTALVDGD
jgi:hypothetical protein